MNPMKDLPMGFGMALIQNEKALHHFESMSKPQQESILAQTSLIQSKEEMARFVNHI